MTDPLTPGERTPAPRDRRTVTVLFADVAGSTALIEKMDVERAWSVLGPAVDGMARAVERYGGTVTKRIGDGLMAIFGVPIMQEDHAQRACHAALAIQGEVQESAHRLAPQTEIDLQVRIGLNSGVVVVSMATDGAHTDYDAVGGTVHLASRLESNAAPGTICLSESTFRHVRHAFACRALGAKSMKGFAAVQPLYQLLRRQENERSRGLVDYNIATPLIGRTNQVASIAQAVVRLDSGEGRLFLIVGEAGIGKSRLLAEARRGAGGRVTWLEGHTLSFCQRISYWPFIELLRPLLDVSEGASDAENWTALEHTIVDLFGDEAPEVLPYVATLIGVEVREPYAERVRYLDSDILGGQILRAARRFFERLAQRQPLVIAFEDLHWADRSSLTLLEHLIPLAASVPILFCVLTRPDQESLAHVREVAMRGLPARFEEMLLAPLSVAESEALVASILGGDERTRRARDLVIRKAEGNPYFIEEVVRALIDARVLVRDDAQGTWSFQNLEIAIPDTVQGVVMARVDRLDERLKDVLCVAAVIGRTFSHRVLCAVTAPQADIDEQLVKLTAIELIEELKSAPERTYRFRHALGQEAIYESLLVDKRCRLHGRVAERLEHLDADRLQEVTSVLAFHYAHAGDWGKALHFLLEAADQSSRMAADGEALAHYEDAVDAYGRMFGDEWDKAQRARVELRLGEIYFRRGNHIQSVDHLVRVLGLFGERLPSSRIGLRLATVRELTRHVAYMLQPRLFRRDLTDSIVPAEELLLRAYEVLGWIRFLSDTANLPFMVLRVVNHARTIGFAGYVAIGLGVLGFALDKRGWRWLAYSHHSRARSIANRFPHPGVTGITGMTIGNHFFLKGQWLNAEEAFVSSMRISDQVGDTAKWAMASGTVGDLWNKTGQFDRALALADTMIQHGRDTSNQLAVRMGLMVRGQALRRLERDPEALAALEEAMQLASASCDLITIAAAGGELCLCLLDQERLDEAQQVLDDVSRQIGSATALPPLPELAACVAGAEVCLRQFEQDGSRSAPWQSANRACADLMRWARKHRAGLPSALRLSARLAWLHGRPREAGRLWRRAIAEAEVLGARVELALAQREMGIYLDAAAQREHVQKITASSAFALPSSGRSANRRTRRGEQHIT